MPRSLPGLATLAALGLSLAAMLVASPRAEAAPSAEAFNAMCRDVAAVAGGQPNVTTGVVIVDLQTGDRCAINGDRTYRSASLYKTVVAAELWRQVDEGTVDLEQALVVEPRHHIDDAPAMRPENAYTVSVYEAASRMLAYSDNGTAFALRELLGVGMVAAATEWLNMPATSLSATFVTSPNDQAEIFAMLARGEVVDEASSQAIVDLLLLQKIVDMIPAGLPADANVRVAHKTGTIDAFLHDAGIVFAPGGNFVLVVMTENASFEGAMNTIQGVATSAYLPYAVPTEPIPAVTAIATPVATTATTNLSDTLVATAPTVIFSDNPSTSFVDRLQEPMILGGILMLFAAIVMAPVLIVGRRPSAPTPGGAAGDEPVSGERALDRTLLGLGTPPYLHYGDNALTPESARLRANRSESGLITRFGSRRDNDGRPASMSAASRSVAEASDHPILPSKRLQRLAEHFRSRGDLLATMRDQFEDEMEPLHELIVTQSQTMHAILKNLEDRLRPPSEYADGEEANLSALEERIRSGGQDHVARSFSTYLDEQRRHIEEARNQIDEQRMPFVEYGDVQRETVESARFDGDLEALEENLAEQRRVMVRMLDAMRSETFTAVKDFLDDRQTVLAELVAMGSTDSMEISRATQKLREGLQAVASRSDYIRALLEQAEAWELALVSIVPAPRTIREEPVRQPVLEDDYEALEDEASA